MSQLTHHKSVSPSIDPCFGWLLHADPDGTEWVNIHEVKGTSGAIYAHQWADLCRAAGVTPQRLPGMPRRERFVTLAEARQLVALAREPP